MNELVEGLRQTLRDEGDRYVYADTVVNALVSAQIKALRENRQLSQQELADQIGTKQSGISRLEKADYSTWKIETLRRLARAFSVRLRIGFEEFGSLPSDIRGFTKERLCPRSFADDPVFNPRCDKDKTSERSRSFIGAGASLLDDHGEQPDSEPEQAASCGIQKEARQVNRRGPFGIGAADAADRPRSKDKIA
jgi:transcriptional regulator with XRE-family HTH domain